MSYLSLGDLPPSEISWWKRGTERDVPNTHFFRVYVCEWGLELLRHQTRACFQFFSRSLLTL
jgi:hypothetical protein